MNQIRREICPLLKYVPNEILNSMFLPLMKKALMGGIEGRCQKKSFLIFYKIFCPHLVYYALGQTKSADCALMKLFLPFLILNSPPKKSAPDEKNPGHASVDR